jgi:hypothetical protein
MLLLLPALDWLEHQSHSKLRHMQVLLLLLVLVLLVIRRQALQEALPVAPQRAQLLLCHLGKNWVFLTSCPLPVN